MLELELRLYNVQTICQAETESPTYGDERSRVLPGLLALRRGYAVSLRDIDQITVLAGKT